MDKYLKIFSYQNQEISCIVKKTSRSKRLKLSVGIDFQVVISAPLRIKDNFIDIFLLKNADWLLQKIENFKKLDYKKISGGGIREFKSNKQAAYYLIKNHIQELNKNNDFKFNRLAIKRHKSRWGSCSKNRNLNFNYKIVFLPENLSRYIVAHELCHLKEFNHSINFWKLVAVYVPDYKSITKEIKKYH